MHLSPEDVEAVNRLLTWRAERVAAGLPATAELRQNHHGEFVATLSIDRDREDDAHLVYEFAYAASITAAIDTVLGKASRYRADVGNELPTQPRHEAPTPIEELIS